MEKTWTNYKIGGVAQLSQFAGNSGAWFDVHNGHVSVVVYYPCPTKEDKEAFANETFKLGLFNLYGALGMALHTESFGWLDTPYTINYSKYIHTKLGVNHFDFDAKYFKEGESCPINFYLLDSTCDKIEGKRSYELPADAVAQILESIKVQQQITGLIIPEGLSEESVYLRAEVEKVVRSIAVFDMIQKVGKYYEFNK